MSENSSKSLDKKFYIIISLFLLSLAIKMIFKVDYLEDYDAIDFAFGLRGFDLSAYKPHFPGYPVYIIFGRVFNHFFQNDILSLVFLNILFSSFSVILVYLIASKLFDESTALLSAFIYMANPAISILGVSVNSDVLGLFFLLLFIYFLILSEKEKKIKYMFFSSLFFGLTLGVRASYAPFFILWLFYSKFFSLFKLEDYKELHSDDNTFISSSAGLLFGILLWLVPLLHIVGMGKYYYEGVKFISGHFNDWGGAYSTDSSILIRLYGFFWQLFIKGLGCYFHDTTFFRLIPTIVFIASLIYFIKTKEKDTKNGGRKIFLLYVVPYLLWVFFAQNLEKVRHVAPLLPIFIIYFSYAIKSVFLTGNVIRREIGVVVILLTILFMFADTSLLLYKHKKIPPPPYSVMKYLSDYSFSYDSIIYCGETERFFSYYNPNYIVKRFKTADEVIEDLNGSLIEPENIYITSTVKGIESLDKNEVIAFSRSRYIYNPFNKITLYKLNREGMNLLEKF